MPESKLHTPSRTPWVPRRLKPILGPAINRSIYEAKYDAAHTTTTTTTFWQRNGNKLACVTKFRNLAAGCLITPTLTPSGRKVVNKLSRN